MSKNSKTKMSYTSELQDPKKWVTETKNGNVKEYFIGELPSKTVINKKRCGAGMTTSEFRSHRNSIIVVPTLGIIDEKASDSKNNLIPVSSKVTNSWIKTQYQEVKSSGGWVKFIVTPESFYRVTNLLKEQEPDTYLTEYFVLLDECHSFVTESGYRDMGKIFKEFFEFEHYALVSATPIKMSDPRFQVFREESVIWRIPIDRSVEIVKCVNIVKAIEKYVLEHKDSNCHVFCNSFSDIRDVLAIINLKDKALISESCVFCSESDENKAKLGDFAANFTLLLSERKKLNFYTTKYFEGVDIEDDNAVVILATVGEEEYASTDISNKGFQAIFRVRDKPKAVYHLTTLLSEDEAVKRQLNFDNVRKRAEFRIKVLSDVMKNTAYDEEGKLAYLLEEQEVYKEYIWDYDDTEKQVLSDYFYFDNLKRRSTLAKAYTSITGLVREWSNMDITTQTSSCAVELLSTDLKAADEQSKKSRTLKSILRVRELYVYTSINIAHHNRSKAPIFTKEDLDKILDQELPFEVELNRVFNIKDYENKRLDLKAYEADFVNRFLEIGPENALAVASENKDITELLKGKVKDYKKSYISKAIIDRVHHLFNLDQCKQYSNSSVTAKLKTALTPFGRKKGHSATKIKDYFNADYLDTSKGKKPFKGWIIKSPKAESEIDISYLFTR
jgi:hypothetical protein